MRRALLFSIVMLLALAGCGGDDDGPDTGSSDAASSGLADDAGGGDAATSGLSDDGSGGDSGGGDPPDPCDLLTLDEVAAQGIAAVSGPTRTDGARFPECAFSGADGQLVLQVQVFAPQDAGGAVGDQVDVAGLGESAAYSAGARTLTIDLSDGSQIVLYSPFGVEPEDPRDTLVELGLAATG